MKSLEEMLAMNFENANVYFKNARESEKWNYISAIKSTETLDCRDDIVPKKVLDELIESKAFILIDGVSGTGKTTLSQRFKSQYRDRVGIVDIDKVCENYSNEMKRKMSQLQFMFFLYDFDNQCEDYINKNLERLILRASKNGTRSVILVGSYLYLIARTVINHTLGEKYFPITVTITIHEKLETIVDRVVNRDNGIIRVAKIEAAHKAIEDMIDCDINSLGIGTQISILADSKTRWWK